MRPQYEHLLNPNVSPAIRRERTKHGAYLNNRYHTLRLEFIERCGGKCACGSTSDLRIRSKKKNGFIFQRIAYRKESFREKILKHCFVQCMACTNRLRVTPP